MGLARLVCAQGPAQINSSPPTRTPLGKRVHQQVPEVQRIQLLPGTCALQGSSPGSTVDSRVLTLYHGRLADVGSGCGRPQWDSRLPGGQQIQLPPLWTPASNLHFLPPPGLSRSVVGDWRSHHHHLGLRPGTVRSDLGNTCEMPSSQARRWSEAKASWLGPTWVNFSTPWRGQCLRPSREAICSCEAWLLSNGWRTRVGGGLGQTGGLGEVGRGGNQVQAQADSSFLLMMAGGSSDDPASWGDLD